MDRREAIQWMLAATAILSVTETGNFAAGSAPSGCGTDPNLMEVYKPGDSWPLTFTKEQHRTVAALCDVILPADEKSSSASQLKVPDFLDEWISAPYPRQQADKRVILPGLDWLERESARRFQKPFAQTSEVQKKQICEDICSVQRAAPAFKEAAQFFGKFRDLTMGGFYSTAEGMRDIQYLGNRPLTKFDGPPAEVLAYLKLA
jgi:hypothetical protein